MKLIPIAFIGLLLTTDSAFGETSFSEAFEEADPVPEGAESELYYSISDCTLQRVIINLDYCQKVERGVGDRIIKSTVFLNEVSKISVSEFRNKPMITFHFDIEKPSLLTHFLDSFMTDRETALQNYVRGQRQAVETANILSSKTSESCGDTPTKLPNEETRVFFLEALPTNWESFVELAKECRAPKSLRLVEDY
ncbi:MAG: hypothetical protein NXH97_22790 [Rhodobacteraceae bacterium]|nr:hypothetical protein [Paracoccaceae bacterium]